MPTLNICLLSKLKNDRPRDKICTKLDQSMQLWLMRKEARRWKWAKLFLWIGYNWKNWGHNMKQICNILSSGWKEGGWDSGKGSADVRARKVSLYSGFFFKIICTFYQVGEAGREAEDEAGGARRQAGLQLPQLSHLLISNTAAYTKIELNATTYSYLNWYTFW